MEIREDDLTSDAVVALIGQHLDEMHAHTPPGSVHALGVDALRGPGITFWSAWEQGVLLGCGGLKQLDARTAEIKSMRTVEARRGQGVGARMLEHLMAEAERRGYERLNLETGAMPEFQAARALYARYGFQVCGPFADYVEDRESVYMTRKL